MKYKKHSLKARNKGNSPELALHLAHLASVCRDIRATEYFSSAIHWSRFIHRIVMVIHHRQQGTARLS